MTPADPILHLAILDDYQHLALQSADWDRLRRRGVEISAFHDAFVSEEEAAARLAPFEIVCLMRERTPFPRSLVERLPRLKLVTLTGVRSPSLGATAGAERGISVSHTRRGATGAGPIGMRPAMTPASTGSQNTASIR